MGTQTTTTTRIEHLKTKPWNSKDFSTPEAIFSVPGMLSNEEKRMLYYLTLNDYTGEGAITDLGSFLGGSTMCFASALGERNFDRPLIHAYDIFKLGEAERVRYFPDNPPEDMRTIEVFKGYLKDYLHLIEIHDGDVLTFPWSGENPIEYLFVDVAKSYRVMDFLLLNFFPSLIPSKSLIIMQDYLWGTTGPWHHVVLEKLSDYCEYVADTNINSMVFFLKKEIPLDVLKQCQWMSIPFDEKVRLMDSAIEKMDTQQKKQFLIENKELLMQGKDLIWGMHYHEL